MSFASLKPNAYVRFAAQWPSSSQGLSHWFHGRLVICYFCASQWTLNTYFCGPCIHLPFYGQLFIRFSINSVGTTDVPASTAQVAKCALYSVVMDEWTRRYIKASITHTWPWACGYTGRQDGKITGKNKQQQLQMKKRTRRLLYVKEIDDENEEMKCCMFPSWIY